MYNSQIEKCFELLFYTESSVSQHQVFADELLTAAVKWAESYQFSIGGGFKVRKYERGTISIHRFGLAVTRDDQVVTFETA